MKLEKKLKILKKGLIDVGTDFYDHKLEIFVDEPSSEQVEVKLAISTDEGLNTFTQKTPIEYTFSATKYYIFYESQDPSIRVRANLYSNRMEHMGIPMDKHCSSHSGSSGRGKFIHDVHMTLCGGDG